MTDEELAAGDRAVRDVWATPVGRRWLLKMAGAAGAGAVLSGIVGSPAAAHPPAPATRRRKTGRTHRLQFHFALGSAATLPDLQVRANGERVTLTPHTPLSRVRLLGQGSLWLKVRRSRLTHYATVRVPRDRGMIMSVHGTRNGQPVLVAQRWHAPPAAVRTVARAAYRLERSYRSVVGSPERLDALGLKPTHIRSVDEVTDLDTVFDPHQTAMTLCGMHPNVATIGSTEVATTKALLGATPEVSTLGTKIGAMHAATTDWASIVPAVNADGKTPSQIKVGTTTTTLTTLQLNPTNDATFTTNATDAVVAGIHGVRNKATLGTVVNQPLDALQDPTDTATWHASEGVVPPVTPYQPPTGSAAAVTAQVQNPGLLYGTYTNLDGNFSGEQQQLKLYNNYVRWVWVYVQYLDASGNNLSANPQATFPDTTYAKSLGLLPQIFTVLGIPIWDTNTIDVTLDFPPAATSARILYCGLGNNAIGDGWRTYLPNYQSNLIAPKNEVMIASIITGIFTIGLSAFALLTDIDIATTWGEIRDLIEADPADVGELIDQILATSPYWLAAVDAAALTLAAGAATYEDVAANGNAQNIWSILAGLGSLIPKIIFNPDADRLIAQVAAAVIGIEFAEKVIDAMPFIGEIVGILEAAGDAVTLAEAIGETLDCPWVIANAVSLTYPATVTVSKDPLNNRWPATARSWRIEATIDGSSALQSTTASFNPLGTSEDDIVVHLNPPFGGDTITWSIVVLDADGHQVGSGAVQLKNDDPANPASTVAFAIKEVPAAVDETTVFTRTVTTSYGPDGYTWAAGGLDTTRTVDEVTGVTVSTRLGVAGIVWKQNDKYYLRGVPTGEEGDSIRLGGARKQGYARRPYLLFDALVGAGDVGNHVLLEPDDIDTGYHVRALTIDPGTGALDWDPTASLAYFTLPVDAAALCPSGWVVAIHTDSGRLGSILPVATPLPPLARYTAGPGTEVGLLSSPVAVAATNRGIVVVLESSVSLENPYQLAAFDVLGNPVRLLGTQAPQSFTLPLPIGRTYLDVALDGSDLIYLLSTDGADPGNYRIDVYEADGTPLDTQSTGTNVPLLAVDYWRSIFAANYTALIDTSTGQPQIDPLLGVIEPSLSRWDPQK